ncbi:MAG: class I SAM-dependent methyltransferase [Clostridiales bacterium]|jgi:SAM-dependent methyltransferase|nr:class I SAM-dependent methyltransferase [Clostridiales bacterium]
MINCKKATLEYYNENAENYVNDTLNADMQEMYDWFLKYLSEGASILDLGCGTGRDSKFFLSKGFKVTAVDGSQTLCDFASEYIGQDVRCMLFEELDYENEFNGIWACASILHVPEAELPKIFNRMKNALRENGYIYISFKYGKGECVRKDRSFTDLTEESLNTLIAQIDNLEVVETKLTGDVREGRSSEQWLNAILKKK